MYFTVVVLMALSGLTIAQNTVDLFIPQIDDIPLYASVVGSATSVTTYFVTCLATSTKSSTSSTIEFDSDDESYCYPGGLTLTQGPSTVDYALSYSDIFVASVDCKLGGTTSAACVLVANTVFGINTSVELVTTSVVLEGADLISAFTPVTITGAALAGADVTASATTVSSFASNGTAASVITSSRTGGVPQNTGAVKAVLGGVGAVLIAAL